MLYSLEFFRQTENSPPTSDRELFSRYLDYLERHPEITEDVLDIFTKYRRDLAEIPHYNNFVSRIYEAATFRQEDSFYPVLRDKNLLIFPAFYFFHLVGVENSTKLTLRNFVVPESPRSPRITTKAWSLFDYHSKICLEISKTVTTKTDNSFYFEFSKFFNLSYPIKPMDEKDWRNKVRKAMIETVVQRLKAKLPDDDPTKLLGIIRKYLDELNS